MTEITFQCPVSLIREPFRTVVSITSPRTGRTLRFNDKWKPLLPARVWGKIVCAVSRGQHVAAFTRDELSRLAALQPEPTITKNLKRICPDGMQGTHLDPNYRFHA